MLVSPRPGDIRVEASSRTPTWIDERFVDPVRRHEPDYGFQGGVNLLKLTVELADGAESCSRVWWFAHRIRAHGVPRYAV